MQGRGIVASGIDWESRLAELFSGSECRGLGFRVRGTGIVPWGMDHNLLPIKRLCGHSGAQECCSGCGPAHTKFHGHRFSLVRPLSGFYIWPWLRPNSNLGDGRHSPCAPGHRGPTNAYKIPAFLSHRAPGQKGTEESTGNAKMALYQPKWQSRIVLGGISIW